MKNHAVAIASRTTNALRRVINRALTPVLAIASTVFLAGMLLPAPALAATGAMCSATGNERVAVDKPHYAAGEPSRSPGPDTRVRAT